MRVLEVEKKKENNKISCATSRICVFVTCHIPAVRHAHAAEAAGAAADGAGSQRSAGGVQFLPL